MIPAMNTNGADDRRYWLSVVERVAGPVLRAGAEGRLRRDLPRSEREENEGRKTLEAIARTLAGVAPFLAGGEGEGDESEARQRREMTGLAQAAMGQLSDPASPDYAFQDGVIRPHVVDAAYLSHAILRAPGVLWDPLDRITQDRVVELLVRTRVHKPGANNWLLFSGIIEATLRRLGRPWDPMRVDYALRQHEQWYLGDGHYGDGRAFHADYYNSYVIHPMLLDTAEAVADEDGGWGKIAERERARIVRYAAVQERMISPEGTMPPLGRSIAYRFGAVHALATVALREELPDPLEAGGVRGAMTALLRRQVEVPGTFDEDGFLRVGLCGYQPRLGEPYISPASCYLMCCGLLPLGLSAGRGFWSDPPADWTSKRLYAGEDLSRDKALWEG